MSLQPGHEIVGRVTAVGSDVKDLVVGDRVGVGAQCGSCLDSGMHCPECDEGHTQHCSKGRISTYNVMRPDGQVTQGGYADRTRVAATYAFKIPDSISSAEAAPLMCAGGQCDASATTTDERDEGDNVESTDG